MTNNEFKEFLKQALIKGYYPIQNQHGFRKMKASEIKEVIDGFPEYTGADNDYKDYINYYYDVLDCVDVYKQQYKLIKVVKERYTGTLAQNYMYAMRLDLTLDEEICNMHENINKMVENIDKNDEKMYNYTYNDEDLTLYKIDISTIRGNMKVYDITHEKLAKILGVSVRSIDRKMAGETEFKALELIKIMKVFNLDIDDILKKEMM